MIYVTHDQVEAMTMGDRIVVMRDGVVQQIDTPLNLYNHPRNRFVAGFIGSPAMNFIDGKILDTDGLWFDAGKFRVRIPERRRETLGAYVGQEVTLGIRPEHIYEKHQAEGMEDAAVVDTLVDVVEPMGSEIYLYLSLGDASVVARTAAAQTPREGERLQMAFDMGKAHFFDKATEETIGYSGN